MESKAGDVGGMLPYSRATGAPGYVMVEEPSELFAVHRDHFPAMLRECPSLTAALVHAMIDRVRRFASTDWQDEKMASLGKLAAGISHELNNPASAASRSAKLLGDALDELETATQVLGESNLDARQRGRVAFLRTHGLMPATTGVFSPLERADREDEISAWLQDHGAQTQPAQVLGETGISLELLDELAEDFEGQSLDAVLRWIAARYAVQSLARDVDKAAGKIYDLVSALKRFTYMDKAVVTEPTDVAQGLVDTVSVLATKARSKEVAVKLDVPADLPRVMGYPAELNQVWANLIENALDAVDAHGHVRVCAAAREGAVDVRVIDNGHGIPAELQSRMFDPFFTTKPIGEGTGLGLDIARRIVRAHHGQIVVDSEPGRTEFRVTIPLEQREVGHTMPYETTAPTQVEGARYGGVG
jgi:signal transduction histidine kinase